MHGIMDESGRLMVIMTHNTDIADGWEREGEDDEFFFLFSPNAYAVGDQRGDLRPDPLTSVHTDPRNPYPGSGEDEATMQEATMQEATMQEATMNDWWAEGLLFENCNCAAVCPGHIHFSQKCTHEVCRGFWAIRFEAGRAGEADLAGIDAVVVYEAPQVMVDGGWKQVIIVSDRAEAGQRRAIEEIISGRAGRSLGSAVAVRVGRVADPNGPGDDRGRAGAEVGDGHGDPGGRRAGHSGQKPGRTGHIREHLQQDS